MNHRIHNLVPEESFLIMQPTMNLQTHNGVVHRREEPYTTILRARPREKKRAVEVFIVLNDADPKHVE